MRGSSLLPAREKRSGQQAGPVCSGEGTMMGSLTAVRMVGPGRRGLAAACWSHACSRPSASRCALLQFVGACSGAE